MKKRYIYLTALLLTSLVYSCKKNAVQVITNDVDMSQTAQIKFFNFGTNAPSMNVYANGTKLTATASGTGAESATGTATGGVFPASNYAILAGGSYTFKGQVPSTATADANLALFTASATIENGKYYTIYASGLYNTTTKASDSFVLEDKIPVADFVVAHVRLVNTISNAPQSFVLYAKNTITMAETPIGGNGVAYKAGSDFVGLAPGSYELYIRYPTAPTVNVITRNASTNGVVSFVAGRVYTIGAKGDITVTSTSAANRPLLDNTANR